MVILVDHLLLNAILDSKDPFKEIQMFLVDYHKVWKNLTSSKTVKSYHIVQLAIVKAMEKYKDDPAIVTKAQSFVYYKMAQAFTPVTRRIKLDNGVKEWKAVEEALLYANIFTYHLFFQDAKNILTKEGEDIYRDIYRQLSMKGFVEYYNREYVYIFVRQDITAEYQAVQSAHATLRLGFVLGKNGWTKERQEALYFTLVGVPNKDELEKLQAEYSTTSVPFYEPDLNNQMTALALTPVRAHKRGKLLTHKRLVFQPINI